MPGPSDRGRGPILGSRFNTSSLMDNADTPSFTECERCSRARSRRCRESGRNAC